MKSYNCVVCIKQVPDTKRVTGEAMKADGTINRAALPAIFNPEDRNALEAALWVKETYGGMVTVITMGLPAAKTILREALMCGADRAVLVTDRKAAGSDTLATSYILSQAVKRFNPDLVFCGRQAIDGDTAQVGPQVAEKLGLTQITYTEEIISLDKEAGKIVAKRHIDGGVETVEGPLPIVVTVNGSAAPCRVRNVKRVWANKNREFPIWGAADIEADPAQIGKAGSPTNVKAVKSIVFKAKENKTLTSSDADVESLIVELMESNTIG